VVRRWLEQFNACTCREPRLELIRFEDHWHSIMDFSDEVIRIRDGCRKLDGE
jgi:hypothetical protein